MVPLRAEPGAPIGARIGQELLGAPEIADPIGDRPLRPAGLTAGIGAEADPQLDLEPIGQTDSPHHAHDRRFGRQRRGRLPQAPAVVPIPKGLFDLSLYGLRWVLPHFSGSSCTI